MIAKRFSTKGVLVVACLLLFSFVYDAEAQRRNRRNKASDNANTPDPKAEVYKGIEWRSIGPYRGGRASSVTGVPGKPKVFYMGATGGGVWKTDNGGTTWKNISDGYFGGSIGAVAVSHSDNNVIYVGQGEETVRGNVSSGFEGIWKSTDGGETWVNMGLKDAMHVGRIVVHPENSNVAWVAVMGDLFKTSETRGVYKTTDGGQNWSRVLFANADAGAVDLSIDPNNPDFMMASTWRVRRTPYSLTSGGDGSGVWRSKDGGETWENLMEKSGMPNGPIGISGVSISPVNPNTIYSIIEANKGGVYKSTDGGETWRNTNSERGLRQRAWYYSRIYADTKDVNKVYVMNVGYHTSTDGGRTFNRRNAPHGDHHDLWIAPEDNMRLVIADDGGAQVSYDGGDSWSTDDNQPTAQFYRVTTDNAFPYRIYGAQQDNSTVRIAHRSFGFAITENDWESTAGGESAHIAPNPDNPDIVYGGSYGGFLTRVDHDKGINRNINAWPDNPMGHGAEDYKYRFQWNFPIFFSPHSSKKLYTASNHLHVTYNEGQSWELISPDLTRAEPDKLGKSGGPITYDDTSVEYYATIFAATESPYEKDLIWAGSDDGLIHVTRDGGKNWENVTPPDFPKYLMINSIDADPFVKGGAYIAGTQYKLGDYEPYLYKTKDYGKTWTKITNGIPNDYFTRVVRADLKKEGLLYAGTERGMFVSFDDGASWKPFQMNLPIVPITDLAIKNDNLIAATQGRAFWMIDDLTILHQLSDEVTAKNFHMFKPMDAYRLGGGGGRFGRGGGGNISLLYGKNKPAGPMIYYYMKDEVEKGTKVAIEIYDKKGDLVKSFKQKAKKGMNSFNWNMRYENAEGFEGLIMWAASIRGPGPAAPTGEYTAKLVVGDESQETKFNLIRDPRYPSTDADIQAQFDFLMKVRDKVTETHQAIKDIRAAREQMDGLIGRIKGDDKYEDVVKSGKELMKKMTAVEEALYQTKNRSGQDPLNFPIRLNNKLAALLGVAGGGEWRPTAQAETVRVELTRQIDTQLATLKGLMENDLPAFNQLVKDKSVDAIILKERKK
ncbi:glycosyl hydrolase [Roseivirga sp. E12]|uniref:VPS10 domain-containing protein n=1 Tax=Roseivirga sp. E12 TaxID=2819237 RepID=UPI001ABBE5A7|nr:glycosyl hydrolase [Roseivirga sp. E12]MBO3700456.1 glycosyl hydrolase [Roseivirga sp. E12]